ncbi:MAG: hypothetical protein R6X02_12085 [Enhygromyxa sp.]
MSDEPPSHPPADPADVESLDAIVTALYDSISFEQGDRPRWDRFCSLFQPTAVMVRVDPRLTAIPMREREDPAVRVSSIDDYVARTTAAIESGALPAFCERELTRRTEVFADLAQVFSTYERSAEGGELRRGINSMQLVKDGARWWIVSLSWADECEEGPLPSRYLPRT